MTDMEIMARAKEYLDLANSLMAQILGSRGVEVRHSPLQNVAKVKDNRQDFAITKEEAEHFQFSDYPLVVTEITRRLNACVDGTKFKELKLTAICNWLVDGGLLMYVRNADGTNSRLPTAFGEKHGLKVDDHVDREGRAYRRVLYSRAAQQFIVDNIGAIIAFDGAVRAKGRNKRVA